MVSAGMGTDFPIVCETCLGPNPYVRMIKCRFGEKLCKVSNVPMQSFRWKAGPHGRFKETIVCREVAVEKNICQACLSDMTFGVPVGVRDALLRAGGAPEHGGYAEALSNANQAHYYGQRRAEIDQGGALGSAQRMEPSRELLSLARQIESANAKAGTAFRNLPKICSFLIAGTCTRVGKGTCPFRPCCGLFKFPGLARNHRDECAALVEDLKANGPEKAMATCPVEVRQMIKDALGGKAHSELGALVAAARDEGTAAELEAMFAALQGAAAGMYGQPKKERAKLNALKPVYMLLGLIFILALIAVVLTASNNGVLTKGQKASTTKEQFFATTRPPAGNGNVCAGKKPKSQDSTTCSA